MSLTKQFLDEQTEHEAKAVERVAAKQQEILDDLNRLAEIGAAEAADIESLRRKQAELAADIEILRKREADEQ